MSALGQKRTLEYVSAMSALPPKADIGTQSWNVCFVPKADIPAAANIVIRWASHGAVRSSAVGVADPA